MISSPNRSQWSNKVVFILAAAGSAIGLGNIWKFPYVAGSNGGGAFVLVYLLSIALVGIPIIIAELYIGQQSQANAVKSFEILHKNKTFWKLPGYLGLISAFLILSFYSVVGGWILDFEFRALLNEFSSTPPNQVQEMLGSLFSNPMRQLFWHFVFMALCTGIVICGVKGGLERWNKILMPALLLILAILLVYSLFLPGFIPAIEFLFYPNFSQLTPTNILEAVGQAFFSLSLGMGAMITYGSYLNKKESLPKMAGWIAFMDTSIALIAGVIIFSVVFSHDIAPGGGPGLIFQTLPVLFAKIPGGYFFAIAFFLLITFAAVTSAVSIFEVVVAYGDESTSFNRKKSTLFVGLCTFSIGILSVLSTNELADFKIFDLTFFDLFDKLTSSYFLPLGGMMISLFMGWVLGPQHIEKVLGDLPKAFKFYLLWTLRLIAPIAVFSVFLNLILF